MKTLLFLAVHHGKRPILIPSLLAQSHQDWRLVLLNDDSADDEGLGEWIRDMRDDRIHYLHLNHDYYDETPKVILWDFAEQRGITGDAVVFTRGSTYYAEGYCLEVLTPLRYGEGCQVVACDYSIQFDGYQSKTSSFNRDDQRIEAVVAKRDAVRVIGGYPFIDPAGDWRYLQSLEDHCGRAAWQRVAQHLLIIN